MAETALPDAVARIRAPLVAWYRRSRRDLPWRRTRDPYAIWISEVMLQQTRVETVAPRYARWLARFPTVEALAAAPLDDVLAEWAGLGYYARARNLHAAAREVAERYGGALPDDADAIRGLPGVGRYTAGAILSIAFGRPEPVLDGNVIRVLSRIHRMPGDPRAPEAQRRLWSLAGALVADGDAGDVNQALMELGATVCTPKNPTCLVCPVRASCAAAKAGDAERYPETTKSAPLREVTAVAVAIIKGGDILLGRRPPEGLWGGLYELPSGEPHHGERLADAARRVARETVGLDIDGEPDALLDFEHVLTHRRYRFHGFRASAPAGPVRVRRRGYDAHRWLTPRAAASLGVSRATRRLIAALTDDKTS